MEIETNEGSPVLANVKASFRLGLETYYVAGSNGVTQSEKLSSMKEESMKVLKEFITKHNVPNDVPDELVESGSEDEEEEVAEKTQIKSKKTKLT